MKAVVKNDTNVGLAYLDVPKPDAEPNEVLIRVHAASICEQIFIIISGTVGRRFRKKI